VQIQSKLKKLFSKPSKHHWVQIVGVLVLVVFSFSVVAQPVLAGDPAEYEWLGPVGAEGPTIESQFAQGEGAESTLDWFERKVSMLLGWLGYTVARIAGWFSTYLLALLDNFILYDEFTEEEGVKVGWDTVRDISNMFFVLVLLVIAIATILRVENYSYKRMLPKLAIMAVLVNFSLVITGMIVGISFTLTKHFFSSIQDFAASEGGTNQLVDMIGLREFWSFAKENQDGIQDADALQQFILTMAIIGIAFVVVAVVLLVMIVIFAFRIVMLWILLILSPLAFLLAATPKGEGYAKQYWDMFIKWVTIGPILVFFLWLALYIMTPGGEGGFSAKLIDDDVQVQNASLSQGLEDYNFAKFIMAIGLLVGGMSMATTVGGFAGNFAGGAMSKLKSTGGAMLRAPYRGAKAAAGVPLGITSQAVQRGLARNKVTKWAIPRVWKEARELKKTRLDRAYTEAGGKMADTMNKSRLFNFGMKGYESREGSIAQGRLVGERKQKQQAAGRMSTEELLVDLKKSMAISNPDQREIEVEAILSLMEVGNKDLNEIFKDVELGEKYGHEYNKENLQQFLTDVFKGDDQRAMKVASRIGNDAYASGDYNAYGLALQNPVSEKWQWTPDVQHGKLSALYMNKPEPRAMMRLLRAQTFFSERLKREKPEEGGRVKGTDLEGNEVRYDSNKKEWKKIDKRGEFTGGAIAPELISVSSELGRELNGTAKAYLTDYLSGIAVNQVNNMRPETARFWAKPDDDEFTRTQAMRDFAKEEHKAGRIDDDRKDIIDSYANNIDARYAGKSVGDVRAATSTSEVVTREEITEQTRTLDDLEQANKKASDDLEDNKGNVDNYDAERQRLNNEANEITNERHILNTMSEMADEVESSEQQGKTVNVAELIQPLNSMEDALKNMLTELKSKPAKNQDKDLIKEIQKTLGNVQAGQAAGGMDTKDAKGLNDNMFLIVKAIRDQNQSKKPKST